MDGVGEWATTSAAMGNGNRLEIFQEIHFPHSLGLLYSAVTYYTGFKVNSGEYKVMGLAPYGEAEIRQAHSRQPDRSEAGRLVPARHVVLRLLHRFHHDQRPLCQIVRRAGAKPGSIADAVSHGCRGLDPVGAGRGRAAADAQPRQTNRFAKPLPGRRRGAQLRRQWKGFARRPLRQHLDSAGRGRCRRRRGRGACGLPSLQRPAANRPMARTECPARFWGHASRKRRSNAD